MTHEDFAPLVGEPFRIVSDGAGAPLILETVTPLGITPSGMSREPFTLLFRGEGEVHEQRTYTLETTALGSVDIFLVPVARDGDAVTYQAVFN